jgi:hypothetical protein
MRKSELKEVRLMKELFDGPSTQIESFANKTDQLISSFHFDGGTETCDGWTIKGEAVVREIVETRAVVREVVAAEKVFGVLLSFTRTGTEEKSAGEPTTCWFDHDECCTLLEALKQIDAVARDRGVGVYERADFTYKTTRGFLVSARFRWPGAPRSLFVEVHGRSLDLPWEGLNKLINVLQQSVNYLKHEGSKRKVTAATV